VLTVDDDDVDDLLDNLLADSGEFVVVIGIVNVYVNVNV